MALFWLTGENTKVCCWRFYSYEVATQIWLSQCTHVYVPPISLDLLYDVSDAQYSEQKKKHVKNP